MPRPTNFIPKYRRKKFARKLNRQPSAFVEIDGVRHHLGVYNSPESREKYKAIVAEWMTHGGKLPDKVEPGQRTVAVIVDRFLTWAEKKHGDSTTYQDFKDTAKPLLALYASTPAEEFGPMKLETVRGEMVRSGTLCRSTINKRVKNIRRMFRKAVAFELIAPEVAAKLDAVEGLRKGEADVRESKKVVPASLDVVEAIRPLVSRQVAALMDLQLKTGARPGELVGLRPCDLNTADKMLWSFTPEHHKTAHKGRERVIYFNEDAQQVLEEFIAGRPVHVPLFSPAEAEAERRQKATEARTTLDSCGNVSHDKPNERVGDQYDVHAYRRAIARACDEAFPPPGDLARQKVKCRGRKTKALRWETDKEWKARLGARWAELEAWREAHNFHPHQLRHTSATHLRAKYGIEVARIILGHSDIATTEIYAEADRQKAQDAIRTFKITA